VATFKLAYLIHGEDDARSSERSARLRALVESGGGSRELLGRAAATPAVPAALLDASTLAIGRRSAVVLGARSVSH
jgi:DNA polymerase-3 subunit delta